MKILTHRITTKGSFRKNIRIILNMIHNNVNINYDEIISYS